MALRDPKILDHTLGRDERAVLDDFCARLKGHYRDRLERVAVFGSRARGDVGIDSDIDLLVVLRVPSEREANETDFVWSQLDLARRAAPRAAVPLAPVVFTVERFEGLRAKERRFALDAENEGIRL